MWPFKKKPAAASLSINRNFYLSVLVPSNGLPTILQILNPDGSNGAIKGYGVPLASGASRDLLNSPLEIGAYALSTKDRCNLIEMHVFARSQVPGFDILADTQACENAGLVGEKLARAQQCEWVINLLFKAYSPDLYPAVRFMLDTAKRIAQVTGGVVADPLAETYRMPDELDLRTKLSEQIDFREICSVKIVKLSDGVWASTRGLVKLNLPEFEMYGIPESMVETAATMLASAGQQALIGEPMKPGETAFAPEEPMTVREGARSNAEWGDRPVLEFFDSSGGSEFGVAAWKRFSQ